MVGLMVFAQLGPLLFLSIPAGVIADRFDRRKWLIAMQLLQLAFSALLAPLAAADAPIWSIFLVALGVGMGNALNAPAWSAMLPTLVSREDLPGSVSLNSAMINGSRVVGPIIVAVLRSAGVSISQIFLINAVTYLFVVGALLRTHVPAPAKVAHAAGLAAAHRRRAHRARQQTGVATARHACSRSRCSRCPTWACSPRSCGSNFGVDEGLHHVRVALRHVGFRRLLRRPRHRHRVRRPRQAHGSFATGSSRSRLRSSAFAAVRNPMGAFIVAPILGFAYFGTTTSMNTVLQSRLADHERGRVMALWFMAFGGTVPLGNLVFAPVIDADRRPLGAVRWRAVGAVPGVVVRHRTHRPLSRGGQPQSARARPHG